MGTNLNPSWERFLVASEGKNIIHFHTCCFNFQESLFNHTLYLLFMLHDHFVDDCKQCQHTSSPLGNGAIVQTSDNMILVLQRSNNVGEFPGYLVFPGGHPEVHQINNLFLFTFSK